MAPDELARDLERLKTLLREISFERRKVTLASGKESDFYIDCRRTSLTAEGHVLIGRLLFQSIRQDCPQAVAVGGMTLGADPLASAVSLTSQLAGHPLNAFIVRKEAKGHGMGQWMEGRTQIPPGATVAVVEDTLTTGGSVLKAIERIEAEGFKVGRVFAVVDRLEGAREALLAKGHALTALLTRKDFLP